MNGKFFTQLKDSALNWHDRFETYLPAAFFAGGFLLDVVTLGEVDDTSNILIFSVYLSLATVVLALELLGINSIQTNKNWLSKGFEYREEAFHFFLGALLSAFTLFYFKSSSLASSFIFLLIMLAILLLNETSFFKSKGIIIRSILIMLALVSYFILTIPTLVGQANVFVFALCILSALGVCFLAFWLLKKRISNTQILLKNFFYPQVAVLIVFVLLYSFRVLPPVPLSIKSIGIFHDVIKANGQYLALTENPGWLFGKYGDVDFKAREGDKVYVATNIFSPAGFKGKVYLHFMLEGADGWMTSDRIPIRIWGGRQAGFRGYAYKENYTPGNWQVRVETDEGLEIGRINFEISPDTRDVKERTFRKIKL